MVAITETNNNTCSTTSNTTNRENEQSTDLEEWQQQEQQLKEGIESPKHEREDDAALSLSSKQHQQESQEPKVEEEGEKTAQENQVSQVAAGTQEQQEVICMVDVRDEKPKRPLSAYNLFFKDERQKLLATRPVRPEGVPRRGHGKMGFAEMARAIGSKWKGLDAAMRHDYDIMAQREKAMYKRKLTEWRSVVNIQNRKKRKNNKNKNDNTTEPKNHKTTMNQPQLLQERCRDSQKDPIIRRELIETTTTTTRTTSRASAVSHEEEEEDMGSHCSPPMIVPHPKQEENYLLLGEEGDKELQQLPGPPPLVRATTMPYDTATTGGRIQPYQQRSVYHVAELPPPLRYGVPQSNKESYDQRYYHHHYYHHQQQQGHNPLMNEFLWSGQAPFYYSCPFPPSRPPLPPPQPLWQQEQEQQIPDQQEQQPLPYSLHDQCGRVDHLAQVLDDDSMSLFTNLFH